MEQNNNKEHSNQMALFFVGNETFGINISSIKEIVRVPELTIVPNAPAFLSGLTNLRNKVLPVIDARVRLNFPETELNDNSRVLVVEMGNYTTGVIVDKVKGVVGIEDMKVEEPPQIISSGVNKKYIKSVIKSNDGEKIVMEFDINTLCAIDWDINSDEEQNTNLEQDQTKQEKTIDETQIVTFLLSDEEYSFPIQIVKEVLRVGNITKVPKAPDFVKGVLTVRNSVLPIIDVRQLFEMESITDGLNNEFDLMEHQKKQWLGELERCLVTGEVFKENLNHEESLLGKWIEHFRTVSLEIGEVIQELRYMNLKIHENTTQLLNQRKKLKQDDLLKQFEVDVKQLYEQLTAKFQDLRQVVKIGIVEDQRIMVVDMNQTSVGLLVDRVQQVLRIPNEIMETPPTVLGTEKSKVLKSIAKIDNGQRIILLLDEEQLLDRQEIKEINEIEQSENQQIMKEEQTKQQNDEIQLVTFSLGKEQFALNIKEVKEINRIDTITEVPQAPDFIEGVMNLRGNVIPVINLRKRFAMQNIEFNEATKVIIVHIENKLTGLIVDSVSEVLRIQHKNIEPTPKIVKSNFDTDFLKGVAKVDKLKKMLMLISVDKILTIDQKNELIKTIDGE